MTPPRPEQPARPYDRRSLTDDQRSLADDIASSMTFGHEDKCAVWWEESDGCSCPLLQDVADALNWARVVEVVLEYGYDPATQRGDHLVRQPFSPHPLGAAAAAALPEVAELAAALVQPALATYWAGYNFAHKDWQQNAKDRAPGLAAAILAEIERARGVGA